MLAVAEDQANHGPDCEADANRRHEQSDDRALRQPTEYGKVGDEECHGSDDDRGGGGEHQRSCGHVSGQCSVGAKRHGVARCRIRKAGYAEDQRDGEARKADNKALGQSIYGELSEVHASPDDFLVPTMDMRPYHAADIGRSK